MAVQAASAATGAPATRSAWRPPWAPPRTEVRPSDPPPRHRSSPTDASQGIRAHRVASSGPCPAPATAGTGERRRAGRPHRARSRAPTTPAAARLMRRRIRRRAIPDPRRPARCRSHRRTAADPRRPPLSAARDRTRPGRHRADARPRRAGWRHAGDPARRRHLMPCRWSGHDPARIAAGPRRLVTGPDACRGRAGGESGRHAARSAKPG